jgi:hypothetical protein
MLSEEKLYQGLKSVIYLVIKTEKSGKKAARNELNA